MQLHLNSNFYVFTLYICFSIQISSNTTSCPYGVYKAVLEQYLPPFSQIQKNESNALAVQY